MSKYYVFVILNLLRLLPGWLIIRVLCKKNHAIYEDLYRYRALDNIKGSDFYVYAICVLRKKEFRNIVIMRLKTRNRVGAALFSVLFKPMDTLYINTCDIGGGLYIQHGFSTIISAKKIGKNCFINQQVTIGFEGEGAPIIEDNVRICAGAKVIGGINIGKNSTIGANAVVVKDVLPDVTMGGVPAKVINYNRAINE